MLSKKELLLNELEKNIDYFICPLCKETLKINKDSLICKHNHTFNINKKGYLFLNSISNLHKYDLYNDDLFIARRKVILSSLYSPIYEKINKIINSSLTNPSSIIDIGGGEASHLYNLIKDKNYNFKFTFDISKPAINMASDYIYNGIISSISDVEKIPIKDNSIDVILDFLSPMSLKECFRILNNKGIIIKVMPTKNYLKEIREALNIKEYSNEENVENNIISKYLPISKEIIEYEKKIDKELLNNLLKMTPLSYHQDITNININKITISLKMIVLKK